MHANQALTSDAKMSQDNLQSLLLGSTPKKVEVRAEQRDQ